MSLLPHKCTPRARTYLHTHIRLNPDPSIIHEYTESTWTTIMQVYAESTITLPHSYALTVRAYFRITVC